VERVRELRSICQPDDLDLSFYRKRVIRPVSIHLTRLFLLMGISANAVSVLKGLIAVCGAILFVGEDVALLLGGILLLQLAFLLDACDGEVARHRGTNRWAGGEYLDKIGDAASRGLLHACWGIGAWQVSGRIIWVAVGAFVGALWLVQRFCLLETLLESIASHPEGPLRAGERAAIGRIFVQGRQGGRFEHLLSIIYHPMINLVTILVLSEVLVSLIGIDLPLPWSISVREGGLALYSLVWFLNYSRKLHSGFSIANFERG
jgi:phosphatidylglycerophosphate synthase